MIKMMFAWRDREDLDRQQCEDHYRSTHMPLARRAFEGKDGFIRLVYNRVVSTQVQDFNRREARDKIPPFDAFVELWFSSQDTLDAAMSAPELDQMFIDHENFMQTQSLACIQVFQIEEEVVLAASEQSTRRTSFSTTVTRSREDLQ
jgi:uncharacterized protein (TIGR02118 family)